MIDLVILPMHDWRKCEEEGFRTRDAHLIQHFANDRRIRKILVINRPSTWIECQLKNRQWHVKSGVRIRHKPREILSIVAPKIYCLDILLMEFIKPLHFRRDWWFHAFNNRKVFAAIQDACSFLEMRDPVLWLWSPLSTGVIGQLGEKLVVFDALDNWLQHPEIQDQHGYIGAGYERIREKADLIFANSVEMCSVLASQRLNPIHVSNGVDLETFRKTSRPAPHDLVGIPRPWIGYAGKITKKLDIDLLSYLAKEKSDYSYIFIGQPLNQAWFNPLLRFKNIYFLGDKHYDILPAYLMRFNVCLIPYLPESSLMMDPLKLYEYLAAGKPVVSTPVTGVDQFQDCITVANSREAFLRGIEDYLTAAELQPDFWKRVQARLNTNCTWEQKARQMIDALESAGDAGS